MSNLQLPLHEIAAKLKSREVSSVDLVEESLAAINQHNPTLNAFRLVLDEEARAAAIEAEAEIASGTYRGPLHGVPVAVKDLMDLAGTTTPAGSIVLADKVIERDSSVVAFLRAAGAIIVGKTHMPEFARSGASINLHYGPVRNPWHLDHDTGGSSSGSGAAVAAGLVFGATGSDTGGSIRIPSSLCGLAGLKPTFGLVSTEGVQPLSWSLDHIGPMTRTVLDAALMLEAMLGESGGAYSRAVGESVSGLRIGLVVDDGWNVNHVTPAVRSAVQSSAEALRGAGADIREIELPELRALNTVNAVILNQEAAACYVPYLRERYDDVSTPGRARLFGAWAQGPADYVVAQQLRAKLRAAVEAKMEAVDLLLMPGTPHEAPPLADERENGRLCGPINSLGWPAMVVPVEQGEHGLPVASQIVGKPWREVDVLRAAAVVERDGLWGGRLSPLLAN